MAWDKKKVRETLEKHYGSRVADDALSGASGNGHVRRDNLNPEQRAELDKAFGTVESSGRVEYDARRGVAVIDAPRRKGC